MIRFNKDIPVGVTPGYKEINEAKAEIRAMKESVNHFQSFHTANKIIREIVTALALGVIQPVSNDILNDLDNNYKEVAKFYKERYSFTPLLIRIKNAVCVFDLGKAPEVITSLVDMINQEKLLPEPERAMEFRRKHPKHFASLYEGQRILEVWINDKLYVVDTNNWNRQVSYDYINSLTFFDNGIRWK